MTDGNLTLAVLAEKAGAEALLRHVARAAKALSGEAERGERKHRVLVNQGRIADLPYAESF